jgi:hypothetical protein
MEDDPKSDPPQVEEGSQRRPDTSFTNIIKLNNIKKTNQSAAKAAEYEANDPNETEAAAAAARTKATEYTAAAAAAHNELINIYEGIKHNHSAAVAELQSSHENYLKKADMHASSRGMFQSKDIPQAVKKAVEASFQHVPGQGWTIKANPGTMPDPKTYEDAIKKEIQGPGRFGQGSTTRQARDKALRSVQDTQREVSHLQRLKNEVGRTIKDGKVSNAIIQGAERERGEARKRYISANAPGRSLATTSETNPNYVGRNDATKTHGGRRDTRSKRKKSKRKSSKTKRGKTKRVKKRRESRKRHSTKRRIRARKSRRH